MPEAYASPMVVKPRPESRIRQREWQRIPGDTWNRHMRPCSDFGDKSCRLRDARQTAELFCQAMAQLPSTIADDALRAAVIEWAAPYARGLCVAYGSEAAARIADTAKRMAANSGRHLESAHASLF